MLRNWKHTRGAFSDWLLSLNNVRLRFMRVFLWLDHFFFLFLLLFSHLAMYFYCWLPAPPPPALQESVVGGGVEGSGE